MITMTPEVHGAFYPTYAEALMPAARWTPARDQAWVNATAAFYRELYDPSRQAGITFDFTPECETAAHQTFCVATGLLLEVYGIDPDTSRTNAAVVLDSFFANADEAYISQDTAEILLQGLLRNASLGLQFREAFRQNPSFAEAVARAAGGLGDWVSDPEDYFDTRELHTVLAQFQGPGTVLNNTEPTQFMLQWVHGNDQEGEEL